MMNKPDKDNDELVFYTVKDLQRILKCCQVRAYELMKTSGFPSIKLNRKYIVEKTAFEKWISKQAGRQIFTY